MRIAIVQFPGSNCERETMLAVKRAGMEPVEFLWNEPREKLQDMAGYILVGGFSYEDRSRAGIIAALDPVMTCIKAESAKGKPVLGICNGAQILVEAGLVPGLENNKLGLALTENKRIVDGQIIGTGFYNAWVNVRLSKEYQRNAFTRHIQSTQVLTIPAAHAEGRFVMSQALLNEIEVQGLNLFQYCDEQGNVDPNFPVNPNGSIHNIAAISNKAGNVLAIMPHPERTVNGDAIFRSMRDYIAEQEYQSVEPLFYYPRRHAMTTYEPQGKELIIELLITDNTALTVQHTLEQRGILVTVKRYVHWELDCDNQALTEIKKAGLLFNERKERTISSSELKLTGTSYLIHSRDDIEGQTVYQQLKYHYNIQGLNSIKRSVIWQFSANEGKMAPLSNQILSTNIISNPNAHECYEYR